MAFKYVGLGIQGTDGYNNLTSVTLSDANFSLVPKLRLPSFPSSGLGMNDGVVCVCIPNEDVGNEYTRKEA